MVPTDLVAAGGFGNPERFPGNVAEQGAYLGLPVLVIVGLFAFRRWREPGARFLLFALGLASVAALGDALHVGGDRIVTMPWALVGDLPIFEHMLPARLTLYVALAAGIVVAQWVASATGGDRILLPMLSVIALIPTLGPGTWRLTPDQPSFFAGAYRSCLARGDNVLVLPYNYTGNQMLWQAQTDFYFRMAGGYVSVEIPTFFYKWAIVRVVNDHVPDGGAADILALARGTGASTLLVEQSDPTPWGSVLASVKPRLSVGGMDVYGLLPGGAARSAACRALGE